MSEELPPTRHLVLALVLLIALAGLSLTGCAPGDAYAWNFGLVQDYAFAASARNDYNDDGQITNYAEFTDGGKTRFVSGEDVVLAFHPGRDLSTTTLVRAYLFTPRNGAGKDTVDLRDGERVLEQYGSGEVSIMWVQGTADQFLARGGEGTYSIWWFVDAEVASRLDIEVVRE